jgi:hypothetical protein
MRDAKRLLELIDQEFPTVGVRNNLTLQNSKIAGTPEADPKIRLVASIWFPAPNSGGSWTSQQFCLDEIDLDKTPEQIVADIKIVRKGLAETKDAY